MSLFAKYLICGSFATAVFGATQPSRRSSRGPHPRELFQPDGNGQLSALPVSSAEMARRMSRLDQDLSDNEKAKLKPTPLGSERNVFVAYKENRPAS